jgi:glucose/arabinose dehydrogenase
MRTTGAASRVGLAVGLSLALGVPAEPAPPLALEQVAAGLVQPVGLAHAGDGSGRLFIVLQAGRIVILIGGAVLPTPFLDITPLVANGGERGLLGLAFHPQHATNGFFFVHYTNLQGNIVIARYQVSGDPNVANANSGLVLLTIPHPTFSNHNGGQLQFGPDGYLYAAVGDGGSGGDPSNNAQNLGTLLGKLLRLDIDAGPPWVPAGNPFGSVIWAYGLRNPWRFSFDRLTGDLFLADVGQGRREEVNFRPAGSPGGTNYGWRRMEGTLCFNPASSCDDGTLTLPILEYDHADGRCSITGGYRYRGAQIPALQGTYLYGDYCSGEIWGATPDANGIWTATRLFATPYLISTFGEDEAGEVYVAHHAPGALFRLVQPRFPGGVFVATGHLDGSGTAAIVTGAGAGGGPHVRAFRADGSDLGVSFYAFDPIFRGGTRIALCDLNGDGVDDIVVAAGPGGGPHVRVFSVAGGGLTELAGFYAFAPAFSGGVFVACGDVHPAPGPELVIAAGAGGGPHVRVFSLASGLTEVAGFYAYAPSFNGGVTVAVADLDGDGLGEIITGAGPGGGPHVRAFSLASGLTEVVGFYAYAPAFSGGVFVAGGDVHAGAGGEIVTGAGPGGGPHIRVFDRTGGEVGGFYAFDPAFAGGVTVAAGQLDPATGAAEIAIGAGPGGLPEVRVFQLATGQLAGFFAY